MSAPHCLRRRTFLAGAGAAAALSALPAHAAPERRGPAAWTAKWIAAPGAPPREFSVQLFRRAFELAELPGRFVVHASGDNRYQLFVNGERVAWGPARGDVANWSYETIDLRPHLRAGRNVVAAVVWNFGDLAPLAQMSHRTGFLLQGDGEAEQVLDTGPQWRAAIDRSYEGIRFTHGQMMGYFVVGPGERLHGDRHPWGWQRPGFDDARWAAAEAIESAAPKGGVDSHGQWALVPRPIPFMEERPERLARLRRAEGVTPPAPFPASPAPFVVPPRTKARLLLDHARLTTGYPELVVSGGKGAVVRLTYAEALRVPGKRDKGNRDEVDGKELRGYHDELRPDGGAQRLFRPLWWRTWRYLELSIETADAPLTVEDLRATFAAYPFERRGRFEADAPELARMMDVGWHTARLCAHETYMDCPYYEQLQYAGDTRIQCLVSLFMSGDDRLMRTAILQLDDSRLGGDPSMSRYPSRLPQYIPGFSLWWIGMVHDHYWYRNDPALLRRVLPGVRATLAFFAHHQRPSGLLGPLPWWNYVDWTADWPNGTPPGWPRAGRKGKPGDEAFSAEDPLGSSSLFDLQHLLALDWAAALERAHGAAALADEHARTARRLRQTIRQTYWDAGRGLLADTAHRRHFSQQANSLAVLAGVTGGREAAGVMEKVIAGAGLTKASIYFRYYVNAAAVRAGLGDRYLDLLGTWREQLALGLTTWAEHDEPSRSDCHAWGSSPNVELLRTVLGVDAAAPGFARVVVRPHLGKLARAAGVVPHPRGEIAVRLAREPGALVAEVTLPPGVDGELRAEGQRVPLKPGPNRAKVRARGAGGRAA